MEEYRKRYRIYIDESGNSDLGHCDDPNHRYLSLTGVIIENEYAKSFLIDDMQLLKDKHFGKQLDNPIIFHRSDMANKRKQFACFKDKDLNLRFNIDFLRKLKKWDFITITVLIDKKQFIEKYFCWKDNPYHYCLKILMERYCHFLKSQQACGDVMIESRSKHDDQMLSQCFHQIYEKGTDFITEKIFQDVFTSNNIKIKQKRENIAGLQISDLVAVPLRNRILEYYYKKTFESERFGKLVYEMVRNKIYSVGNKTWGYGMKKLP